VRKIETSTANWVGNHTYELTLNSRWSALDHACSAPQAYQAVQSYSFTGLLNGLAERLDEFDSVLVARDDRSKHRSRGGRNTCADFSSIVNDAQTVRKIDVTAYRDERTKIMVGMSFGWTPEY